MASAKEQTSSISADGSWHNVIGSGSRFPPEAGLFCPFAHRANLIRHLKGLTDLIDISVVNGYPKGDDNGWPGWRFPKTNDEYPCATVDKLFGSEYLHEIYLKAEPQYKGRFTVPVLWDKKTATIVNNESAELMRFLQAGFDDILPEKYRQVNLYPDHLRERIDEISKWMQAELNTGVYKAGFAKSQEDYEKNVVPVFAALNKVEGILAESAGPYVLGSEMTEIDIRLYATAVRFDVVYVQHFKCNLGMVRSHYPLLNRWMKNLYWNVPGFKETTNFKHIKENYTKSHPGINPKEITPIGPVPDIEEITKNEPKTLGAGGVELEP
ncbi:MAG: hypothetical protein M1837_002961 [Sclerophora amabilis]|nr:MAG: hypothetical protein M1837_002961 [Sclerophora amabilis]